MNFRDLPVELQAMLLGNEVGTVLQDDGQQYEIIELMPHTTKSGKPTMLATWRSNCATCDKTYTFKKSALDFGLQPPRRCEAHRNKSLTVAEERRQKGLPEPKKVKPARAKTQAEIERSEAYKARIAENKRREAVWAALRDEKRAKRQASIDAKARQKAEQEAIEAKRVAEIRAKVEDAKREREVRPLTVFD